MVKYPRYVFSTMLTIVTVNMIWSCSSQIEPSDQDQLDKFRPGEYSTNGIQSSFSRALRIESAWSSADILHQSIPLRYDSQEMSGLEFIDRNNGGQITIWNAFATPSADNLPGEITKVFYKENKTAIWNDISPVAPTDMKFGQLLSHRDSDRVYIVWTGKGQCFVSYYDDAVVGIGINNTWSTPEVCSATVAGQSKKFFSVLMQADGSLQFIFKVESTSGISLVAEKYSPNPGGANSVALAHVVAVPTFLDIPESMFSPQTVSVGNGNTLLVWKQGDMMSSNNIVSVKYSEADGWSTPTVISSSLIEDSRQLMLAASSQRGTAELIVAESPGGRKTNSSYTLSFSAAGWSDASVIDIGKKIDFASNTSGDMLITWVTAVGNTGFRQILYSLQSKYFSAEFGWQPTITIKQANFLTQSTPKPTLDEKGEASVSWLEKTENNELFVSYYSALTAEPTIQPALNARWSLPELVRQSNLNTVIESGFTLSQHQTMHSMLWVEVERKNNKTTKTVLTSNHLGTGSSTGSGVGQIIQPPDSTIPALPALPVNAVISTDWTKQSTVWSTPLLGTNYTGVYGPRIHFGVDNRPILHFQEYNGSPFLPNQEIQSHVMYMDTLGDWQNGSPVPAEMQSNVRYFELEFAFNTIENVNYAVWSTNDDLLYLNARPVDGTWSVPVLIDSSAAFLRVSKIFSDSTGLQIFWITDKAISTVHYSTVNGLSTVNTMPYINGQSAYRVMELAPGKYAARMTQRQSPLSNINVGVSLLHYQAGAGWRADTNVNTASNIDFLGLDSAEPDNVVMIGRVRTAPVELTDSIDRGPLLFSSYSSLSGWSEYQPVDPAAAHTHRYERAPFLLKANNGNIMMIWATTSLVDSSHQIYTSQYSKNSNGIYYWNTPVSIADVTSAISFDTRPKLTLLTNGDVLAFWVDQTSSETNVWTSRYSNNSGWQLIPDQVIKLSVDEGFILDYDVVTNVDGKVHFVWKHLMSNSNESRFSILSSETAM